MYVAGHLMTGGMCEFAVSIYCASSLVYDSMQSVTQRCLGRRLCALASMASFQSLLHEIYLGHYTADAIFREIVTVLQSPEHFSGFGGELRMNRFVIEPLH